MKPSLRHKLGVCLYDLLPHLFRVHAGSRHGISGWQRCRNRRLPIRPNPNGRGLECLWEGTTFYHPAWVFPALGQQLLRRALHEFSVPTDASANRFVEEGSREPVDVSILIGHAGADRLGNLRQVVNNLAAFEGELSVECIVVDQSPEPLVQKTLSPAVRVFWEPRPDSQKRYNRSRGLNLAAARARGRILVLHDNDFLVPSDYLSEIAKLHDTGGWEVINLKRHLFHLDQTHSQRIAAGQPLEASRPPQWIFQNLDAGGSLAVSADAYRAVGGMDESFRGWGGEDNEFWDRVSDRRVWNYGLMPLFHLWHQSQPGKSNREESNRILAEKLAVPRADRIGKLRSQNQF